MNILVTKYQPDHKLYIGDNHWTYYLQSFIRIRLLSCLDKNVDNYNMICLTSHRSVDWVVNNYDLWTERHQFICLTHKQADRLNSKNLKACSPENKTVAGIHEYLLQNASSAKVLVLRGNRCVYNIKQLLRRNGFFCDEVIVYETTIHSTPLRTDHMDAAMFFSPSGIEGFFEKNRILNTDCIAFAIGETTARVLKEKLNRNVIVSPVQEEAAFLQFVKDELSNRKQ